MKRRFFGVFLLTLLALSLSAQAVFAQARFAVPILVVNVSFLNVRSGDGPQYTIVATVPGGTELPVLGTNADNRWYLVSTPVGAGWVDVSFTLPRGDFTNVPQIDVEPAEVAPLYTPPLSIGLPGSVTAYTAVTAVTPLSTTTHAVLNVISVNLRTQPSEEVGAVIKTLYKDDNMDYPILGYAYDDRGVHWVSIWVPGVGAGWIEEPKITRRTVTEQDVLLSAPGTTLGGIPVPVAVVGAARIVINTSYQNVRSGPGGGFGSIAVVAGGTVFEPVGVTTDGAWYLVRGDFGQGWVSSEFVLFRGDYSSVPVIHSAY